MSFDDMQEVSLAAEYFMFSSQVDGEPDIILPSPKPQIYSVQHTHNLPSNGASNGGVPDINTNNVRNHTVIKTEVPLSSMQHQFIGGGIIGGQSRVITTSNNASQSPTNAPMHAQLVGGLVPGIRDSSIPSESAFSCSLCPAKLKNKRNFDTHMKRHRGELPFKCDECPKTFQGRRDLETHKRSRHEQTKVKTIEAMNTMINNGVVITPSVAFTRPTTSSTTTLKQPMPAARVPNTTENKSLLSLNGIQQGLVSDCVNTVMM